MRISLVKIGNSTCIRLPKSIVDQVGLTNEVDLEVLDGKLIVSRIPPPRDNWEADATDCHAEGEDDLSDWDATTADFASDDLESVKKQMFESLSRSYKTCQSDLASKHDEHQP